MEFSFAKFKILVDKFDISSLFQGWFSFKKENHVHITYIINLPKPTKPQVISSNTSEELPKLENTEKIEISFNRNQIFLIEKINTVHKINGLDYDFKKDYAWALYYIQKKPAKDWLYNAAMRIAQAIQDIEKDFWKSFENIEYEEKKESFNELKKQINYLHNRIIQEWRHTDKRNQVVRQFKAPYHNIVNKDPQITDKQIEEVFEEFQKLLIELFTNFKLKSIT